MEKNNIEKNKRSFEDQTARGYLTIIRRYQRQAEDAWFEVRLNKLKLKDYLDNQPPKSDLEYLDYLKKVDEKLQQIWMKEK